MKDRTPEIIQYMNCFVAVFRVVTRAKTKATANWEVGNILIQFLMTNNSIQTQLILNVERITAAAIQTASAVSLCLIWSLNGSFSVGSFIYRELPCWKRKLFAETASSNEIINVIRGIEIFLLVTVELFRMAEPLHQTFSVYNLS